MTMHEDKKVRQVRDHWIDMSQSIEALNQTINPILSKGTEWAAFLRLVHIEGNLIEY